jgi:beta-lactamase regulating signal transducer with metallopeptidase domain
MLPILLEAAIRSLILAAVVWLGLTLLRVRNPHIQMAVWQLVLAASLSMPFLVQWAAFTLPGVLPAAPAAISDMFPADAVVLAAPAPQMPLPVGVSPAFPWRALAVFVYVSIAVLLLLRLLIGAFMTWKLCRSALPVREDWTAGRDVRASAAINVPVTFGSTILLPATYADWDVTARRAVMAHESAHVGHGDFYVLILAAINKAVFWFSPAAWWLHNRIAYLAEARSDAAAIQDIKDRLRYAEILVDFGGTTGRVSISLAMARTQTVRSRVERILAEKILPRSMGWKAWAAVIACIVPLAAMAAGAFAQTPVPAPAQTSQTSQAAPAGEPIDPETVRQRQAEQKKPRKEVQVDPAIFNNYVGYYQLEAYRVFKVTRQDDHLFIQLTGEEMVQLFPESPTKFFYKTVPAQISFNADAQGRASGLVLHQNGFDWPAPRIEQAQAQLLEETFAKRLKGEAPMPGSEVALQQQIVAFSQGHPDLDAMTPQLAAVTRPQVPKIEREFALIGELQSLSFRGVGFSGWDIYEAKFANGINICRILLAPDGKISGLRFDWGP